MSTLPSLVLARLHDIAHANLVLLAGIINDRRASLNISGRELARQCDIEPGLLAKFLSGHRVLSEGELGRLLDWWTENES